MLLFYISSIGVLSGLFFYFYKIEKNKFKVSEYVNDMILSNIDAYILLVNSDFIVEKTNYYTLTKSKDLHVRKRVGELLNCTNAIDAGECGTHEDCKDCPVRNAISHAFSDKKNFRKLETPMQIYVSDKGDSTHCHVSVSGTLCTIRKRNKILLTIHDITESKKIFQALEIAKDQAEQSDRLKSAFLANMSHEIRTPLNAITGFSELLTTSDDDDEKENYAKIVRRNNDLLLQLISDILDISKIESDTLSIVYSKVDINSLIFNLQQIFQNKSEQVTVSCHFPVSEFFLETDEKRVTQIISNFINNALKFTEHGKIDIGYELLENNIYIYVEDTGIGIAPEHCSRIFNRFIKLDKIKQGCGLGLAICKMLVEKLNGEIGVESVPGKGSKFWFTLPFSK